MYGTKVRDLGRNRGMCGFHIGIWLLTLRISEAPVLRLIEEFSDTAREELLLYAIVALIALNTLRAIPLYLGCFYLGEGLDRYGKLLPMIIIPLSYNLVELISGERSHHFGMPASFAGLWSRAERWPLCARTRCARELVDYVKEECGPDDASAGELEFMGNKIRISRALVNLLENAAHAVQEIPDPQISINYSKEGDLLKFSVRDNGSGVSENLSIGLSGHDNGSFIRDRIGIFDRSSLSRLSLIRKNFCPGRKARKTYWRANRAGRSYATQCQAEVKTGDQANLKNSKLRSSWKVHFQKALSVILLPRHGPPR